MVGELQWFFCHPLKNMLDVYKLCAFPVQFSRIGHAINIEYTGSAKILVNKINF